MIMLILLYIFGCYAKRDVSPFLSDWTLLFVILVHTLEDAS